MTTAKITITIPKETLAKARREVRKGVDPSVSAYISKAVEQRVTDADLERMLDEMLEESGGPATKGELKAADEMLGFKRKAKPRRSR